MTQPLRIVYAGTPAFAVPALQALQQSAHHLVAVYTQPDRPAGRGKHLAASAVKQYAMQHQLPIEQPLNFKDPATVLRLQTYAPDVLVVAAYGLLLPQAVLDVPTLACLNIHASLLPRWRGAAPIQRAILAGDHETGVCIMRMEAGLDTGPLLCVRHTPIRADETAATLQERLAILGAETLLDTMRDVPAALQRAQVQSDVGVCYAKKISKQEALIDWQQTAVAIEQQVRAFNPWPVAQTQLHTTQLRIWNACLSMQTTAAQPGQVLHVDSSGIHVATAAGVLILTQVQLAGRKAMSATEFSHAHALQGVCLGSV